jgi:cytochrome c5
MTFKSKTIAVAILGIFIYSCSPKIIAPVAEVKKELTPELAAGKGLYENNCAKCHKLFEPSRHTKEDWIPVVDRMAKKARITDEQKVLVYNYIVSEL